MILITTPTGQIGRQVLARLLPGDEPLRVVVRDPARLPAEVRDRVDVVAGSHGDPAVAAAALDGADAVFWLVPPDPRAPSVPAAYVDFARPAADVLRRQPGTRVVAIGALGRGTDLARRAGFVTGSLAMDDLLRDTGVPLRTLALPSFMDNIARQAQLIREQGFFTSPIRGELKLPTVATRDIAAVAAGLLADRGWHGVAEVPVLGPEDLSFDDMAGIMSEVLGREIRFRRVSFEAYQERFLGFGMSEAMAEGQAEMARAKDAGLDLGVARTPGAGTPTTFRQWCEEELKPVV